MITTALGFALVALTPDSAPQASSFIVENFEHIGPYIQWEEYQDPRELRNDLLKDAHHPNRHFFGIYHEASLLGLVRLVPLERRNWWNLVYAKGHQAPKGVMTESLRAIIGWLQGEYTKATLEAEVNLLNSPSQRLLENVGFSTFRETGGHIYYRYIC